LRSALTTIIRVFVSFGSLWYPNISLDTKGDGVEDRGKNGSTYDGIIAGEHSGVFRVED
jgi:hypothetical protein